MQFPGALKCKDRAPSLAAVGMAYMLPMGIYEFGLGFWRLVKGIQTPIVADSAARRAATQSPNQTMQDVSQMS